MRIKSIKYNYKVNKTVTNTITNTVFKEPRGLYAGAGVGGNLQGIKSAAPGIAYINGRKIYLADYNLIDKSINGRIYFLIW